MYLHMKYHLGYVKMGFKKRESVICPHCGKVLSEGTMAKHSLQCESSSERNIEMGELVDF